MEWWGVEWKRRVEVRGEVNDVGGSGEIKKRKGMERGGS